jgi:hypothetical protein
MGCSLSQAQEQEQEHAVDNAETQRLPVYAEGDEDTELESSSFDIGVYVPGRRYTQ